MAMRQNFYYQGDPGAAIGAGLARALFGDPAAAQAQQEHLADVAYRKAMTEQAGQHARLYGNQADIAGTQGAAIKSLPELIASLAAPAPVAAPVDPATTEAMAGMMGIDPMLAAPAPEAAAPGAFDPSSLAAVIGALAQSRGENVDISETIGTLGAMLGDDELARRSLIAQGHTPGENFALDATRADAISARDAAEDYTKDTAVATINNRDDIPVARIQAETSRRGQDVSAETARRGQDIKSDGDFDMGSAASLGKRFGQVTSTYRTPEHNRKVGGVANSYHTKGRGIDIARAPGVTHAQVAQAYRDAGYNLIESLDEGDHSHFALAGGPKKAGKGAKPAAPKAIDTADRKMIEGIVKARLKGKEGEPGYERYRASLIRRATQHYQTSGNPDDAVAIAIREGRGGGNAPAPKPSGGPVRLTAANVDAEYAKLASGQSFIGPDGKERVKP